MVQIVATLASLLIGMAALAVIALTMAEEWDAFVAAIGLGTRSATPPLPPRTRQLTPARRARMVRLPGELGQRRAA